MKRQSQGLRGPFLTDAGVAHRASVPGFLGGGQDVALSWAFTDTSPAMPPEYLVRGCGVNRPPGAATGQPQRDPLIPNDMNVFWKASEC